MPSSQQINILDQSLVGEARRRCVGLAQSLGFPEAVQGRLAIAVTELGNNLVRHAGSGQLIVTHYEPEGLGPTKPAAQLEILALDTGPGMADVGRCLEDGYSTAGTPGTGLGAVRRLADTFDIYSQLDKGTAVLACFGADPYAASCNPMPSSSNDHIAGGVCLPYPGELVAGDAFQLAWTEDHLDILVVDGLGHGLKAHEASAAAVASFVQQHADREPRTMIQELHEALRHSRGAAVAIARVPNDGSAMTYCGVGNISASLQAPLGRNQGLVSSNGIVGQQMGGQQMRSATEFRYEQPVPGLLVLWSDGLQSRWDLQQYPGLWLRQPSLIAGILLRDFKRGRDDATVIVVKRRLQ